MGSVNDDICLILEQISSLRLIQGNKWKAKSYKNAIHVLRSHPVKISSGSQASKLNGIGKSISDKIDEILSTGTLNELSECKDNILLSKSTEKEDIIKLFTSIERVGPVTAKKWYDMGYRSINDIPLEICTTAQQIGIKYHSELIQRIPRHEITLALKILRRYIDSLGYDIKFEVAGSYRRGANDSGDMDILVINNPLLDVMSIILSCPIFTHTLSKGNKKFLGIGKIISIHRRIDVEIVQPVQYPYALCYFTGSASFNVQLRDLASKKGYRLNEKGLYKSIDGQAIDDYFNITTEEQLLNYLGLPYINPKDRSDIDISIYLK